MNLQAPYILIRLCNYFWANEIAVPIRGMLWCPHDTLTGSEQVHTGVVNILHVLALLVPHTQPLWKPCRTVTSLLQVWLDPNSLNHVRSLHGLFMTGASVDSLWPTDNQWRQRSGSILGSGNGLLPDGTKPSPVPMSIYHQRLPVEWKH